ncbi:hypothetical protein [Nocardia sp. NPDC051463]
MVVPVIRGLVAEGVPTSLDAMRASVADAALARIQRGERRLG